MIISFLSGKGGVGKTTACVNTAGCLSKMGKKVLVMDLDIQASTTSALGIETKSVGNNNIFRLFDSEKNSKEIIFTIEELGVDVAPSIPETYLREGIILEKEDKILARKIEELKNYYDFILIDTRPGFEKLTRNAIFASDLPIGIFNESVFSYETFDVLKKWALLEFEKPMNYVIITRMQGRSSWLSRSIVKDLSKSFKRAFVVPFDKRVQDSQAFGLPLSHLNKRSKALKVYYEIADWLIKERFD
jgi:ATPases involved in chromosome partitioning